MVKMGQKFCPKCGGVLRRYDDVRRIVRTKDRVSQIIQIQRLKCESCEMIHRELPDDLFPYKQYEAEIIRGVLEGFITCETLGFEDFPTELTMARWRSQKIQLLLWR